MRTVNQRGFSLAEALIASGILAIVVAGVTTMVGGSAVSDVFKGRMQSNNACLAEANRILNNFKQKGLVRSRFTYPLATSATPLAAATTITSEAGVFVPSVEAGIALADRWDTNYPIYGTPAGGIYPLRPHMEIMGYMNALQAIYNKNKASVCPGSGDGMSTYADGDGNSDNDLLNGVSSNSGLDKLGTTTQAATAYLKIQPFQTTDGAIIPCGSAPASLDIRPPHAAGTTPANSATTPTSDRTVWGPASGYNMMTYTATAGQNYPTNGGSLRVFSEPSTPTTPVENRGWAVTVTVKFKDRNSQDKSCSVQEKFQYSAQPSNISRFEFQDIDDVNAVGTQYAKADNQDDFTANGPDNLNGTIRVFSNSTSAPVYPATSATVPSAPNSYNPTNTIFYGCGAGSSYSPSVKLRLKNVRPGSIMMCRNLSQLRPQPTTAAGAEHMPMVNFPQRTTFYSTELLQGNYFSGAEGGDGVMGDMMVMGLYYPRNNTSGDYYCRTADGCANLPRFARGYTPASGTYDTFAVNPGDPSGLTRHYRPITGNAFATAATTTGWAPCETMDVCNDGTAHKPDFAGFVPGNRTDGPTGNDADAYHLYFNNLPVGCEVHIQMAEVDAGYNVQATDFREYIHEKIPGDKLCRNGRPGRTILTGDGVTHGENEWFFACSNNANYLALRTSGSTGSAVPSNTALSTINCAAVPNNDIDTPCCVDFPFYPEYRSNYDP